MTAPAGWKPDPENDNQWRYWDGEQWTEHRAPRIIASPPHPPLLIDDSVGSAGDERGGVGRWAWPVAGILGAVALVAVYLVSQLDWDEPVANEPVKTIRTVPAATAETTPPPEWEQDCPGPRRRVNYFVDGSARSVNITMETPTGTQQQADRSVPLSTEAGTGVTAGCFAAGDFVYISAQNQGERGSVECRIEVDGESISENSSVGAYVIASCNGSA